MGEPTFEELEGLYLTFSNQKTGLDLKMDASLCMKGVMR